MTALTDRAGAEHLTGPWWRLADGTLARDDGQKLTPVSAHPVCDVMRGDGSIPQPTCILPAGHGGAHFG